MEAELEEVERFPTDSGSEVERVEGRAAAGRPVVPPHGRQEDGLREFGLGEEADRPDPVPLYNEADVLRFTGRRLDESRARLLRLGEVPQRAFFDPRGVAEYASVTRDVETALRRIDRAEALEPPISAAFNSGRCTSGRRGNARRRRHFCNGRGTGRRHAARCETT
jgi:hypothetical protein